MFAVAAIVLTLLAIWVELAVDGVSQMITAFLGRVLVPRSEPDRTKCYTAPMKHYICTGGCKGVSDKPGVCQAEDCPKRGQPLDECDCEDGRHHNARKETPKAPR